MANVVKYAIAAGAGYALHSYLNREKKVYKPTPLNEDTLAQKIAGTVATHISDKVSELLYDKPTTRYGRS